MKVLYFSWVRARIGMDGEEVEAPAGVSTPLELMAWLRTRGGGYEAAFSDPSLLRVAVDLAHVGMEESLAGADEVAFFPPVTGG